jgi:uncharacterized membrane protein YdcZ (DUF606 family)
MTTLSPAAPVATRTIGLKHVALAVFVFMTLFVLYGRDLQLLDAGSDLRQRYAPVPWWMLAHGIFGALALFLRRSSSPRACASGTSGCIG